MSVKESSVAVQNQTTIKQHAPREASPKRVGRVFNTATIGQSSPSQSDFDREFVIAVTQKRMATMRPADMLRGLRDTGLRSRIGEVQLPEDACWNGFDGHSAKEILLGLRQQAATFASKYEHFVQTRILYFYQVQMCPRHLRERMSATMGLTFLSNDERGTFPRGTRFWSLDDLRILTLNLRLDRHVPGHNGRPAAKMDHVDVRVHVADVDREHGIIQIGGSTIVDGAPHSRCILSRLLSYSPGGVPLSIPRNKIGTLSNALALHRDMELAAISDDILEQSQPQLPRPYLIFSRDNLPTVEHSPGLQGTALGDIRLWLRLGCPVNHPLFSWSASVGGDFVRFDPDNVSDWSFVQALLGDKRTAELLTAVWYDNCVAYGDDLAIPASFFDNNSSQKPFVHCKDIVVQIDELLGRKVTLPDGREVTDSRAAAIQIIKLPVAEKPLIGKFGDYWEYDFTGTEIGLEADFQ